MKPTALFQPTSILRRDGDASVEMDLLDFRLPAELEASEPPEARGLARDAVRLMVSYSGDDRIVHSQFCHLPDFLDAGDVVVINTSGTLNAALSATRADGQPVELHLSTRLPGNQWIVEVRLTDAKTSRPFYNAQAGEELSLPAGATARLLMPHNPEERAYPGHTRLWMATLDLPSDLHEYLRRYGFPIRYSYVHEAWPNAYYQTVYVTEMGSAEMPSAGRAFTPALITRLVAKGVQVVPLLLHTGVASLEDHEPPYEEYYRVPPDTARIINSARISGKRVIAVGTTVIRALETVTTAGGIVQPGEGWTRLVITPDYHMRAANALLTGLHEPRATHLAMLKALAGRRHIAIAYSDALEKGYLWHEFGDLHLILS